MIFSLTQVLTYETLYVVNIPMLFFSLINFFKYILNTQTHRIYEYQFNITLNLFSILIKHHQDLLMWMDQ